MKLKKIISKFDKKRFFGFGKIIAIIFSLFLIINLISITYSKYSSNVSLSGDANIAFFVIDQGTQTDSISLTGLTPSENSFYYTFNVSNFKNNRRTDVDLEYTVEFETTTNMPLEYELICNESFDDDYTNLINNTTTYTDEYGVYYKKLNTTINKNFSYLENQTDQYFLKVTFPITYKNNPDFYQGLIDLFTITINASQVA